MISSLGASLQALALAALLGGCGQAYEDAPADPSVGTEDADVEGVRKSTEYQATLRRLVSLPHVTMHWHRSVDALVSGVVEAGNVKWLELLDEDLGRDPQQHGRRLQLHAAIASAEGHGKLDALRRRLAARDRGALYLAPFREGGIADLVRVAEDEEAESKDRVMALQIIADHGDTSVLARLLPLVASTLESETDNAPAAGLRETLGEFARRAIERIRARSAREP